MGLFLAGFARVSRVTAISAAGSSARWPEPVDLGSPRLISLANAVEMFFRRAESR